MKPVALKNNFSKVQITFLVVLRVVIGWHFLYEGIVKLLNPDWSAFGFLMDSKWIFSDLFHWMANNSTVLTFINIINIWGLILIGIGLILGLFTRVSIISGIVLLSIYYLCAPPLVGLAYLSPSGSSYLIVDKNIIEIAGLLVLSVLPTGKIIGIDRLLSKIFSGSKK